MQVSGGVVAAGVAVQTVAVAPQAIAPAEPVPTDAKRVTDSTQAAALAMATMQHLPDAATVATMQSLAGLPPAM